MSWWETVPERESEKPGWRLSVLALSLWCLYCLTLFYGLDRFPLNGYDDAIYAHEAEGLLSRGAVLDIRFNGSPRYESPPLFTWTVAASFAMGGVSDRMARVPAALFAALTFWILLALGRELELGWRARLMSLLVFASSGYFVQFSRRCMTDVPFAFFISAAMLLLLVSRRRPWLFPLAFLVAGLGALTKSLLALVFPLMAAVLVARFRSRWRLQSRHVAASPLLFVAPVAGWMLLMYPDHGLAPLGAAFIQSKAGDFGSPHFYFATLWGRFQPWYLFWILGLVWNLYRIREFRSFFLIFWTLAFLVPLSLVEAQVARYLMPAFPAMALTAVHPAFCFLVYTWQRRILLAATVCYLGAVALFLGWPEKLDRPVSDSISTLARRVDTVDKPVLLFRVPADRRNEFLWYSRGSVIEAARREQLDKLSARSDWILYPSSLKLDHIRPLHSAGDYSLARVR